MGHELSHPALFVRVVDQVDLIDDVHQMMEFGDAPEHLVDAQPGFPFALAELAEQQEIGLAQIGMGALRIGAVVAVIRCQREASTVLVFEIERGFRSIADAPPALAPMRRLVGEPAALQGEAPGELGLDVSRPGGSGTGEENPACRAERDAAGGTKTGREAFQRHAERYEFMIQAYPRPKPGS